MATRTPEAAGLTLYTPGHVAQAAWSSPLTNSVLLEAGWGNYLSRYANSAPRVDGSHVPGMISVLEQCSAGCPNNGGIGGLTYRLDAPLGGGFQRHQIGSLAHIRASISYVPGAHSFKFGYQGGFSNPSQKYHNLTEFIQYRFNNGVPNQLTQSISPWVNDARVAWDALYVQEQWTLQRLTLTGRMAILPPAQDMPELPWLMMLGWYLAVMMHRDDSAACVVVPS